MPSRGATCSSKIPSQSSPSMTEIKSQLVLSTECLLGRYQLKHGSLHIHKNGHQEVYLNLYRAWSDTVSLIPASQKFSATIFIS